MVAFECAPTPTVDQVPSWTARHAGEKCGLTEHVRQALADQQECLQLLGKKLRINGGAVRRSEGELPCEELCSVS